ncbi:unnamed protein product [Aspergillus niger]|uniref:Contig An04c0130, genomic contig n=1 Tax=Aspergillus niger (strain ATCC MYA-4892 / CBS 513.88 / FGSC A1513) TaxID=425011 RepID=A2QIC8_ASPNC|nr:unnamed protein product [Aspergillus niger]
MQSFRGRRFYPRSYQQGQVRHASYSAEL